MAERNGARSRGTSPRQQGSNPRTTSLAVIEERLIRIERKLDHLLGHEDPTVGVRTLPDGRIFLPGTGTLGERALSDEAQAALDALETERPA